MYDLPHDTRTHVKQATHQRSKEANDEIVTVLDNSTFRQVDHSQAYADVHNKIDCNFGILLVVLPFAGLGLFGYAPVQRVCVGRRSEYSTPGPWPWTLDPGNQHLDIASSPQMVAVRADPNSLRLSKVSCPAPWQFWLHIVPAGTP